MSNDEELLRAANAQWAVVPMTDEVSGVACLRLGYYCFSASHIQACGIVEMDLPGLCLMWGNANGGCFAFQGRGGTEPTTEPAVMICDDACCAIGRDDSCNLILEAPTVRPSQLHLIPASYMLMGSAAVDQHQRRCAAPAALSEWQ